MKTIEQEFAEKAYEKTEAYGNGHPKGSAERDKYVGMAQTLPILVRTAGLAEALAFAESRKENKDFLEHLASALDYPSRAELLKESREAQMQNYVFLTRRVMMALKWFKRFSQSVLDADAAKNNGVQP